MCNNKVIIISTMQQLKNINKIIIQNDNNIHTYVHTTVTIIRGPPLHFLALGFYVCFICGIESSQLREVCNFEKVFLRFCSTWGSLMGNFKATLSPEKITKFTHFRSYSVPVEVQCLSLSDGHSLTIEIQLSLRQHIQLEAQWWVILRPLSPLRKLKNLQNLAYILFCLRFNEGHFLFCLSLSDGQSLIFEIHRSLQISLSICSVWGSEMGIMNDKYDVLMWCNWENTTLLITHLTSVWHSVLSRGSVMGTLYPIKTAKEYVFTHIWF